MNKTPSVFLRDPENMHEMTREVNLLCLWVLDGEGVPTRKYDGTCVMLDDNLTWWARREVKKDKVPPKNWVAVETDDVTGKRVGWVPMDPQGYGHPLMEALSISGLAAVLASSNAEGLWRDIIGTESRSYAPGTYELCGPKINGNPEKYEYHVLIKHSDAEKLDWTVDRPATYDAVRHMIQYLHEDHGWEGLVWHHPDGRMAKMKARDYAREV